MADKSKKRELVQAMYGYRGRDATAEAENKHKFWNTQPVPQEGALASSRCGRRRGSLP